MTTYRFSVDPTTKSKDIALAVLESGLDEIDYLAEEEEVKEAMRDHVRSISNAVDRLTDCIGSDDDYLDVQVVGKANSEHQHSDDCADETITITVRVVNGSSWP